MSDQERYDFFRSYGLQYELDKLKTDLENFRVRFDNWFSESSLYGSGNQQHCVTCEWTYFRRRGATCSVQQHLAMTKTKELK